MYKLVMSQIVGAIKAAHAGPTILVVSASFFLALSQFPVAGSLEIAVAILSGQLIVGWSNDVIDFPRDSQAGRRKKPLVSSLTSVKVLKRAIVVSLVATVLLSFLSPLGLQGTLLHMLGVLSAVAYNFKLKSTIFSPLPYIISFGAMPWVIFLAADEVPPLWIYLGFILFSTAFHFLNVLKDLQWDLDQGVLGLPQRLGRNKSVAVAAMLIVLGLMNVLLLS
jgi:4-hydroxybenzoate polyprenyltransferase